MKGAEIGFGVIGLGVGMGHCQSICDIEGVKLVAVSDLSEDKCRETNEKYGVDWHLDYHDLLGRDDVDAVMVCTPSGLHMEIAIDAAEAGKHVLVEKPIEITLEKADQIIDACRKAGVKLAVNFHNRYYKDNVRVKRAMEAGALGKPILGEATMKQHRTQAYYDKGGWRGTWKMDGGGAIMNQTIHDIDVLVWFMGDVETIFANTTAIAHEIETEDIGVAVLTFKNGAFGTILGTTAMHRKMGSRIELHGDKGTIVTEENKITTWELTDENKKFDGEGVAAHTIADMGEAIINDREPLSSGEEARKTLKVVLALYESARTGKLVQL